jgi:hypothetical protein
MLFDLRFLHSALIRFPVALMALERPLKVAVDLV